MFSSLIGLRSISKLLVSQYNVDINHKNRFGETCLHIAKRKGLDRVVFFLTAELGCDLDIQNADGVTVREILEKEREEERQKLQMQAELDCSGIVVSKAYSLKKKGATGRRRENLSLATPSRLQAPANFFSPDLLSPKLPSIS